MWSSPCLSPEGKWFDAAVEVDGCVCVCVSGGVALLSGEEVDQKMIICQ